MFNLIRIEETLVRLEERALELTMASPSPFMKHEHDLVHTEAKALRPIVDMVGGEFVWRLDRVQVALICANQRWLEFQQASGSTPRAA